MAKVNLDDISSNSDSSRKQAEEAKPEVIDNDYIEVSPVKRKNLLVKGLSIFGVSTDFNGALKAIWEDVLIPTFLDGCRDSMYTAADYIFGGNGNLRRSSSRKTGGKRGYTSYGNASKGGKPKPKQPNTNSYYIEYEERVSDDPDHPGAVDVLEAMNDVISQIGFVTIQDMLTCAKKTTSNYTLGDWGWNDISRAMVRRNNNGMFYIDLPRPVPIEDK